MLPLHIYLDSFNFQLSLLTIYYYFQLIIIFNNFQIRRSLLSLPLEVNVNLLSYLSNCNSFNGPDRPTESQDVPRG